MPDRRPILVAADSFKGTLSASEVAAALADGIAAAGAQADRCPVGDGGEGTLDALGASRSLERHTAEVHDPLGRAIEAEFALLTDDPRRPSTAIVEVAAASGLTLVGEHERDAFGADSAGTGELIAAAIDAGARHVLVCAGGSATTDGGAGAIRAIDAAGGLGGARLTVLCDVRTSFERAAEVFGPQKGADADTVRRLNRRLRDQAARLPRDPRGIAMTGAAGGLAGGLWAVLGAELAPGAAYVLDAVGFDERMLAARLVITGEGRLDEQSLAGKAVSEVATRARQSGVPCVALVGRNALGPFEQRILDLQEVIEAGDAAGLRRAGRRVAGELETPLAGR